MGVNGRVLCTVDKDAKGAIIEATSPSNPSPQKAHVVAGGKSLAGLAMLVAVLSGLALAMGVFIGKRYFRSEYTSINI